MEFEMAYQARIATERIECAIKRTFDKDNPQDYAECVVRKARSP